jgi:16S rRNA processing protein RimM
MTKYVSVGKIVNFHGIKGEAKVGYSKSQLEFLMSLDIVYLKDKDNYTPLNIISAKPHKNLLIMKFEGIDSINDIIPLKGELLFVDDEVIRETLEEDEFLIDELVGLEVFDNADGKKLGFVIGVSNNGATDLISVKTNSKKICLVPFVNAIVPVVDLENKKIIINNLEGLLE